MSNSYRKQAALNENQRRKVRDAIEKSGSLADIAQETSIRRVVEFLLEDKPLLERYLTAMAGLITKQRQQISYRLLTSAIFHTKKKKLSQLDKDFLALLTSVIDKERERQKYVFIVENHFQIDIHSDLWKMYKRHGDALSYYSLDFSLVCCHSLRYELKCYHRFIFERSGKADACTFRRQAMALNALTEINPQIKYFADITETDAKAMLLLLENTCGKNGSPLTQGYIASAIANLRRVVEYLMGSMRDADIKTPRPHANPFSNIAFHNLSDYIKPTPAIPEDIVIQINEHSNELSPLHKLLYDIFMGTGLRLKEVFFLETDCIEDSRHEGIRQLKFKPYKVITARRRHNAGDYHRIMIPQALADRIIDHISNTDLLRTVENSPYIFLSQRPKHPVTIIDPQTFVKNVRYIIKKYDIRDENGQLWHFTSRQFRKTIAVTLIENGATTAELAYWLGHLHLQTAATYYSEVRKTKLAELNTKFFREKFDLIVSAEQLENYTEEERRLLYVDFRLEQRRVELGYCLIKAADGQCSNRSSLYNCVNCKNLCTGQKYLPFWNELLTGQETVLKGLVDSYRANRIEDYADFMEYKQELRLLNGYRSIVAAIKEGRYT